MAKQLCAAFATALATGWCLGSAAQAQDNPFLPSYDVWAGYSTGLPDIAGDQMQDEATYCIGPDGSGPTVGFSNAAWISFTWSNLALNDTYLVGTYIAATSQTCGLSDWDLDEQSPFHGTFGPVSENGRLDIYAWTRGYVFVAPEHIRELAYPFTFTSVASGIAQVPGWATRCDAPPVDKSVDLEDNDDTWEFYVSGGTNNGGEGGGGLPGL